MEKSGKQYIFESPDGGKTVYRRKIGESEKELWINSRNPSKYNYGEWGQVVEAATTDPVLMDMIEELMLYYALKHKH